MGAALTALARAHPVRQVSVRAVDIRGGLKTDHFKYSTDCFWVGSRQEPAKVWCAQLSSASEEVIAYFARDTSGHPHAELMSNDDTIAAFENLFNIKAHVPDVVGNKSVAGCAFPVGDSDKLAEVVAYWKSTEEWKSFISTGVQQMERATKLGDQHCILFACSAMAISSLCC